MWTNRDITYAIVEIVAANAGHSQPFLEAIIVTARTNTQNSGESGKVCVKERENWRGKRVDDPKLYDLCAVSCILLLLMQEYFLLNTTKNMMADYIVFNHDVGTVFYQNINFRNIILFLWRMNFK